jgi:hypothetical protein
MSEEKIIKKKFNINGPILLCLLIFALLFLFFYLPVDTQKPWTWITGIISLLVPMSLIGAIFAVLKKNNISVTVYISLLILAMPFLLTFIVLLSL